MSAIRRATSSDIVTIARHRTAMFHEMYDLTPEQQESLTRQSETFLASAIGSGEYAGWLACPEHAPSEIIAGAGVQVRRVMPFPVRWPDRPLAIAEGRQALVVNVYTEPAWRRRGIAAALMHAIIDWARDERIERLVLHASKAGRAMYERLGFAQTNEMRYMVPLVEPTGRDVALRA